MIKKVGEVFREAEIARRIKELKAKFTIKYKYYKVDVDGNYEEFNEAVPDYFDYDKPFYLITDLDYVNGTLQDDDLSRRIDHIATDGPLQLMYCPPVKEDLEFIYTMNEYAWIAGVYASYVIKEGKYAGKKCGYHFFTDNKGTHRFTKEGIQWSLSQCNKYLRLFEADGEKSDLLQIKNHNRVIEIIKNYTRVLKSLTF